MASTYSDLKFELITTGEQAGTWGATTNTNIGTAIQEAITGSANVTFASGTVTLSLSDTNNSQTARNLRLNLTGTSGGAQNLIVPAIEKQYIVYNGCADTITIKNSTGTGVAVPAGKSMVVFNNGTNVVDVTTHATSLTLGSALPIASGGTGSTSTTYCSLTTNVTGTLPVANGGTGITSFGTGVATFLGTPSSANLAAAVSDETGSGSLVFATSPTLVTPVLGTPTSGTLTNCTDLPIVAGTTGTLSVARGGTGATTLTGLAYGNGTSAFTAASAAQVVAVIGSTAVTNATNATNATYATSAGSATNATYATSAGSATSATNATNATQITNSGGWGVTPSGTTLYFSYNGTDVAKLDSSGNLTVAGDVTAYGTV